MLRRQAASDKILLLGIDGLDPRLTKKYVDEGLMPNIKKYIERGACRDDLVMLGGHPTVTPPMWTTLATGCYANVHGITGFFRCGDDIDLVGYNFDSRNCRAEQLWNVFAESGRKTLVFHWPGSSWPPTSDSPNLMVVDGSSPGAVGMSVAEIEREFLVTANENQKELKYIPKAPIEASSACVVTNLELDNTSENIDLLGNVGKNRSTSNRNIITKREQMTTAATEDAVDIVQSPIKPASGWSKSPEDAKEFTVLLSKGYIRRPALIIKNDHGVYDKVAIYKTKKDEKPIVILPLGEMVAGIVDDCIVDDKKYETNRNMKLLRLDPEGKNLSIYISSAMDIHNDSVYHPKRLHKELIENVGYPTPTSLLGRQDPVLISECMLANWYVSADWQANALHYLIEHEHIDVVFSHFHSVDIEEHEFIKHLAERPFNRNPVSVARKWMEDIYVQADYYLGKFLHFLDEGWTVIIMSDHGQVAPAHEIPQLIEAGGVSIPLMEKMGFTKTRINEKGEVEIDWMQTKAVLQREGHIYLNIKGRNRHGDIDGIVDPADQYELEEEIMTKLYELKDPETGHRIVSIALRNRDAVLLGMGGPESGDIICWHAEGYNFDHDDCLSTTWGESDTSVSPIFIAAGKGIKEGFVTERIIREIDFAATVAVLGGVRMPHQCEGAPVYQILSEEY